MQNPYEMACAQLEQVADLIHLKKGLREMFPQPKRELTVHFPVTGFSTALSGDRPREEYGTIRVSLSMR